MTTPFWCILLAFGLIHVPKGILWFLMLRSKEGYDHKYPRAQQAKLTGFPARALACHKNGFENFAPFVAGVFVAHLGGADPHRSAVLAMTFIVARMLYTVAYLADAEYLRTLVWSIGMLATVGLFGLAWLGS